MLVCNNMYSSLPFVSVPNTILDDPPGLLRTFTDVVAFESSMRILIS